MRIFEGFQRGVNLGGWLSQCRSMEEAHFQGFIQKEDIARIASWGLDHVRLPVDCDVIFADRQGTPHARMRHVDDCIAWCGQYGLNVVLDLHKTFGYMFDRAVVPDPDAFFREELLQDAFVNLWQSLARRYGDLHERVAFELLNEVADPRHAQTWNRIARRAVEEIRLIAPKTYILIGGVNHNSVSRVSLLDPPRDERIVYNFHCYEPLVFTHQKAGWLEGMPGDFSIAYPAALGDYRRAGEKMGIWQAGGARPDDPCAIGPEYFDSLFRDAMEYAERMNAPLYCGEYGVIDQADPADAARWYRDIHSVFVRHGIGRAAWSYKQMDFGLTDAHYDAVRDELLQYL